MTPPRAPTPKSTVEVPRSLIILLVCGLVACLVGLAYLIGRDSGRAPTEPVTASTSPPDRDAAQTAPAAATSVPAARPPRRTPPVGRSSPAASPRFDPASSVSEPPPAPTPAPAPRASVRESTTPRDAVARYFEDLDAIGRDGLSVGGDPETLAMAILGQATTGDASAFDELANEQRSALARLRAITPPAPARDHHRRSVALLEESITLLDRLKTGLREGNLAALGELSAQAQRLKRDAEQIETLAADVKQRFGLDR